MEGASRLEVAKSRQGGKDGTPQIVEGGNSPCQHGHKTALRDLSRGLK